MCFLVFFSIFLSGIIVKYNIFLKYFQASGSSSQIDIVCSHSQSFTGIHEQVFNREDWNAKASTISLMEDDSNSVDALKDVAAAAAAAVGSVAVVAVVDVPNDGKEDSLNQQV